MYPGRPPFPDGGGTSRPPFPNQGRTGLPPQSHLDIDPNLSPLLQLAARQSTLTPQFYLPYYSQFQTYNYPVIDPGMPFRSSLSNAVHLNPGFPYFDPTSQSFTPQRGPLKLIDELDSAVQRAWHDLEASKENVSSHKVVNAVLQTLKEWSLFGVLMQQVPSLNRLLALEGKINAFIHCFVGVRTITTLYDLELEICKNEEIKQFEELRLGPKYRHPLVLHYFPVDPAATKTYKITTEEVILELSEYIDICKSSSIDADDFLDFLANNRSVKGKTMLSVRIQSLGMHVAFIRGVKRSNIKTEKNCREGILRKSFLTSTIEEDLQKRPSLGAKMIESFPSRKKFCGKHTRFASSSSESEGSDGETSENNKLGSYLSNLKKSTSNSDRVSRCPYPSASEEISRLGLTGSRSTSVVGNRTEEHNKSSSRKKRKSEAASCPTSLQLSEVPKRGKKQYNRELCTGPQLDTANSSITLSLDAMKKFITLWKEACKEHSVGKVLEDMLNFYNVMENNTSYENRKIIKATFETFPFIGLLNVAVASIKSGTWDNIYDTIQSESPGKCISNHICESITVDYNPNSRKLAYESSEKPKSGLTAEDIISMINKYNQLHHMDTYDGKHKQNNLTLLKSLYECEMWLVMQIGIKDFKSIGYGNFTSFLVNYYALLSPEARKVLFGDIPEKAPIEAYILPKQLNAIVFQAMSLWGDRSQEKISALISRQFPSVCLNIIENRPFNLATLRNDSGGDGANGIVFSAVLMEGFKDFYKRDDLSDRSDDYLTSVTSNDAIAVFHEAPMLSDLRSWSNWDVVFGSSLGSLVEWLLNEVRGAELCCLVTQDGGVIKIDHSATVDLFLEAVLHQSSFKAAVQLLSLFSLAGGVKHVPLSLLKCYANRAFDVIFNSNTGNMEGQAFNSHSVHSVSGPSCAKSLGSLAETRTAEISRLVPVASRFVLDCLGYLPSEFRSFAADVLLFGMQSVVKYAAQAILSECKFKEKIMLHQIGLLTGVVEWTNPSLSVNISDVSDPQGYQLLDTSKSERFQSFSDLKVIPHSFSGSDGQMETLLVQNKCGNVSNTDTSRYPLTSNSKGNDTDIDKSADGDCCVSDSRLLVDINNDANLVIESIRKTEFGLDSTLSATETSFMKKHRERLGRALYCLSQELYSQDSHFLLELVQNADDNSYPQDVQPTLSFILVESGIVVLNNELGFSAENIRALCDVGHSTKLGSDLGYVGQKGIGFKSVFRITDAPEIHSNGFHIKFDISEGQIGYVLPTSVPPCDIESFCRLLFANHAVDSRLWRTCILLPFRSKLSEKTATEMFLGLHPSLLLFLHRLQCIIYRNMLNDSILIMRKELVGDGIVNVLCGDDKLTWLVASQQFDGHISGPKVKRTEISIAFALDQLNDGTYIPMIDQQPVFSFLPLRVYGLKFILQGDFTLPSSREEVDKNCPWNQWLLTKFPSLFVSAEKLFCALPCFSACPGKAVAAYMSFIPLAGEVHGFFSGLPRAIMFELRRSSCLLVEGDELKMVPPCNVLRGWNEKARCLLPKGLLNDLLGLEFLDKNVILSDSVARALGVAEYGAETLIKFMVALCDKENGLQKMGFEWLSSWLAEIYTMLPQSGQMEFFAKLRCIPCIPLSDNTYSSVNTATIWFPYDDLTSGPECIHGMEIFSRLYGKLRMVNPMLLAASSVNASPVDMKVSMLHKIGIQPLSGHDVMKLHVLPALCDEKSITEDKNLMAEYLCFVIVHIQSSCAKCFSERKYIMSELLNKAFILTNHGYRRPAMAAIHFSKEFGNPININNIIDVEDVEWLEVETIYLKHPANKLLRNPLSTWRDFFQEIGVTDFVHIFEKNRSSSSLLIDDIQKVTDTNSLLPTSVVRDWDSAELVQLLSFVSKVNKKQRGVYLLEALDTLWEQYLHDKTSAYYSASEDSIPIKSSLVSHISNTKWVASSLDDELHYPRELFNDCDAVRSILGSLAPYACPKVRSLTLPSDIGLKTVVSVTDVTEILKKWREPGVPFLSSTSQFCKLYSFVLNQNIAFTGNLLEEFCSMPFIFSPLKPGPTSDSLLHGTLVTSKEVCWHDPTGCLDLIRTSCESVFPGVTNGTIKRTIYDIYPGLHDFFVKNCNVLEEPSSLCYPDILCQMSNCMSPSQSGNVVFQVLLKWAKGLKSGSLGSVDISYLRKCLKKKKFAILPSHRDKWVSKHKSFGAVCWSDDEDLLRIAKQSDSIHILSFTSLGHEQDIIKTDVFYLMQKLKIPSLSEIIIREAKYRGVLKRSSKVSLISWALPYAQRYICALHNDIYVHLKESWFTDLSQLQVIVVEKLEYRNRIRGGKKLSNRRFECNCILQGTTLYTKPDLDFHALFLEFSRLFFGGKPEIHLANFLHLVKTMVESGCSDEHVESFIVNSQKVPKLPPGETVWFLQADDTSPEEEDTAVLESEHMVTQFNTSSQTISDWNPAADTSVASANDILFYQQAVAMHTNPSPFVGQVWQMQIDSGNHLTIEENIPSFAIQCEHTDSNSIDMDQSSSRLSLTIQSNDRRAEEAMQAGRLGELVAFNYLKAMLGKDCVKWVNEVAETFLPYDMVIDSKEHGQEYVEVKATRYSSKVWFTISAREWQFAVEKAECFSVLHVLLDNSNAKVTMFKNPAKLCQLGKLQLAILMKSKDSS